VRPIRALISEPSRRVRALPALAMLVLLGAGCGGADREPPPPADTGTQAPPATGERPPAGRTREPLRNEGGPRLETVAEGLEAPWQIAFLPDRRALITERTGRVRLLAADGTLRERPVAEIAVRSVGEGGLLGLAVDPRFEENRLVYLYRTVESGNEVVRYRLEGAQLTGATVVLDGIEAAAIHDGGRIHFGPDGALYASTGEAGEPALAQDPDSLNGKILRLTGFREGRAEVAVISSGHRNVQGFDWDERDRLFATEFGPDSDDEVNLIRRGRNYGWPEAQGTESGAGFEPALVEYQDVISPSGATFVSMPGSEWSGSLMFGALSGEQIRRVVFDGTVPTVDEALFEGDLGRVRTVVEGPDGALYALTNNTDGRGSPSAGDDRVVRIIPPAG
jgi:glucose/arabinose dehydrogenase